MVVGVFVVGQFLEGNILQPRLVGSTIGVHPVWLMFALFAFGSLFGFVGVLLAVPVTAAIGVLVRFAIERYRLSALYLERRDERGRRDRRRSDHAGPDATAARPAARAELRARRLHAGPVEQRRAAS